MQVTTIGLDLAKRVFQAHGVDAAGRTVLRRKLDTSKNPVSPPAAVAAVGHWRHAGS